MQHLVYSHRLNLSLPHRLNSSQRLFTLIWKASEGGVADWFDKILPLRCRVLKEIPIRKHTPKTFEQRMLLLRNRYVWMQYFSLCLGKVGVPPDLSKLAVHKNSSNSSSILLSNTALCSSRAYLLMCRSPLSVYSRC